ncbi:4Fe-4S binding protein [Paramaledivibacter caminithermalis]|uniref:4Fe-4S dicluster domain-containing protein n=1 Tax=Paramaledivibacter caminithermalis (strain DSM 15212 / CIP 107654 / DViRD3) TaxID=1121301 RepID=A0A1M6RDI8_PARC5|nr:4Fe-4S binding protein [Paramaledivibacter caminithermalis]SHK30521.1 4Fe-4S dicluster domain-containing protein [Paramaledivibacter caminithermalis DSM 15212]
MKRNIISIDEKKCVGCGLCVNACHQGALKLIDGKAKLVSESYCDGLGMCLPKCPTGALKIVEKEVKEFDSDRKGEEMNTKKSDTLACGCPSTNAKELKRNNVVERKHDVNEVQSELRQWPCQIKLVPVNAPYFNSARLLIAADCTAFANANVHSKFMKNKITLIGCPKLDSVDYSEKLTEIIKNNDIKSIDVLRMSVPCCGGIENAVKQALINSGKMIPWRVIVISPDGEILE